MSAPEQVLEIVDMALEQRLIAGMRVGMRFGGSHQDLGHMPKRHVEVGDG